MQTRSSGEHMTDEQIKDLLRLVSQHECHDNLYWGVDLVFAIKCSDMFCWACADAEPITGEDIPLLQKALEETDTGMGSIWGGLLFVARKRGMRPQGAAYDYIDNELWHLFDACGPKREVSFVNPKSHPDDRKEETR